MPAPISAARRFGFTLIELLVVISVIALLIALSLPALAKAKSKAQTAVCSTRMKGLSTALSTYLAEWNETVPLNGVIFPKPFVPVMYQGDPRYSASVAPLPDQWRLEFGALWPYMGGTPLPNGCTLATAATNPPPLADPKLPVARAYLCPTDTLERTHSDNGSTENDPLWIDTSSGVPHVRQQPNCSPGYWSYSVNPVLNSLGRFRNRFNPGQLPWADPLKMFTVKSSFDFLTFIEEANDSLFNDEVFDPPSFNNGDKLTNRHENQGNVAYADGHVESLSAVVFNNPPSNISGTNVTYVLSDMDRKFYPDHGAFADVYR